jgi:hypothetical protein
MKKVLALAAAIGAFVMVKRKKGQESAGVWQQATRHN